MLLTTRHYHEAWIGCGRDCLENTYCDGRALLQSDQIDRKLDEEQDLRVFRLFDVRMRIVGWEVRRM